MSNSQTVNEVNKATVGLWMGGGADIVDHKNVFPVLVYQEDRTLKMLDHDSICMIIIMVLRKWLILLDRIEGLSKKKNNVSIPDYRCLHLPQFLDGRCKFLSINPSYNSMEIIYFNLKKRYVAMWILGVSTRLVDLRRRGE